jgi:hypothetical protein
MDRPLIHTWLFQAAELKAKLPANLLPLMDGFVLLTGKR